MTARRVFVVDDYCFIPHPGGESGHWLRTDRSVAFVHCPACGAKKGEACFGHGGKGRAGVHGDRKTLYTRTRDDLLLKAKRRAYVIVEEYGGQVDV